MMILKTILGALMNIRLLAASLLFVAVSVHAEPASTESIENLLTAAKAEALLNSMCAKIGRAHV